MLLYIIHYCSWREHQLPQTWLKTIIYKLHTNIIKHILYNHLRYSLSQLTLILAAEKLSDFSQTNNLQIYGCTFFYPCTIFSICKHNQQFVHLNFKWPPIFKIPKNVYLHFYIWISPLQTQLHNKKWKPGYTILLKQSKKTCIYFLWALHPSNNLVALIPFSLL